jgi:pSer/pThr/pTyr-binding forkhead associated (FHA) protein
MATLRIPFPESDTTVPVPLRGGRITIGRLPDNTVQIRDRTVSAHHAEIVEEGDHYRVHDLEATNAVLVNGQVVSDFHLREACRIAFGGVECEFDPNGAEEAPESVHLISQSEREELTHEVEDLKKQIEAMRHEREALLQAHAENSGATVPQVDFDRVVGENTALVEMVAEGDREIERIKAELAVVRHDRDVLQREFEKARHSSPEVRVVPVMARPAPVAPQAAPEQSVAAAPQVASVPTAPRPAAIPPVTPPEERPKPVEPKFDPELAAPLFQRAKPAAPSAPGVPAVASAKTAAAVKPPIPLQAAPGTNGGQPKAAAPLKPVSVRATSPAAAPKAVAKTQRIA